MPFQFAKTQNPEHLTAADFGLLAIRVITVITLGYYQIFNHLKSIWGFLWEEKKWELIDQVQNLGLPYPSVIAIGLLFLIALSMLGIFLGIFTRINALLLLLLLGIVLVSQMRLSAALNPQALVLFLGIQITLILSGGGKFSLDNLLAYRKSRTLQRNA